MKTYDLIYERDSSYYIYFIVDKHGNVANIKILKQETLNSDMKRIGFQDFDMYVNKNSIDLDYYSILNADSIKYINEKYRRDFEVFGYEML